METCNWVLDAQRFNKNYTKERLVNLYKQTFAHWAPKDSEAGIKGYFLAENNEQAYKEVYGSGDSMYVERVMEYYEPEEHEAEFEDTPDEAKARVIKARGDLNLMDDYTESMFADLYYGLTLHGWELVKPNVTEIDIQVIRALKILEERK